MVNGSRRSIPGTNCPALDVDSHHGGQHMTGSPHDVMDPHDVENTHWWQPPHGLQCTDISIELINHVCQIQCSLGRIQG